MTSTSRQLTPNHVAKLAESAISESEARDWGIFSVVVPDDLPPDLAEYQRATGIVFPLRKADGSVVHQIRLDDQHVKPHGPKYLQPKGTGAIVNVPEMMADRVGEVTKKFIVEGTKQTIAGSLNIERDWAVIGIQGCANFSHDGIPLDEWSTLIKPGDEVVICFDADWTSNFNVWDAARKLKGHAEFLGAASVRMAAITGGSTMGLDDALRTTNPDLRTGALMGLVTRATAKLGRQPARKTPKVLRLTSEVEVDTARGQIVRKRSLPADAPAGATAPEPEVLLNAAARIVEVESVVSEEDRTSTDVQLTLEVTVPVESGQVVTHRVKVASSDLATAGSWLDRLPGGLGVAIPRETKPNDDIANAIRSADGERTFVSVIPRTGWHLDMQSSPPVWRWVDGKGAIGPDDKITSLRGRPASQDFHTIDVPDPSTLDPQVVARHVREFVTSRDLFLPEQRFKWDVAMAGWGLSFLGVTPNAAIAFFGPPSSGKSTIAQAIASTLNPAWAPGSGSAMSTFNARPAGMDLLANGMSHTFLHVDDLKPDADTQSMKNALKGFDALLRRAHGSGGAVRGGVDKVNDALLVRKVDSAAPFVFVTGEEIPTGGDFAESGLDRALMIEVQPRTLFGESRANLDALTRRAKSGQFRTVTSAYVRWIAEGIDIAESDDVNDRFAVWTATLEARRAELSDATSRNGFLTAEDNVSDRGKLLAASLMLGIENLLTFARDIGAITDSAGEAILVEFEAGLRRAVRHHTSDVMGGNTNPAMRALSLLRSAVASRSVSMDPGDDALTNRPLIGQLDKELADGTRVVAINHQAAATALRYPGGPRALSRALSSVAVLKNGLPTRQLRLNGALVQVVCVPKERWEEASEDDDPASTGTAPGGGAEQASGNPDF